MSRHDNCGSTPSSRAQQLNNQCPVLSIETCRRLIRKNVAHTLVDCPSDTHPLLLTTTQQGSRSTFLPFKANDTQKLTALIRNSSTTKGLTIKQNILDNAPFLNNSVILKNEGSFISPERKTLLLTSTFHMPAPNNNLTLMRRHQQTQHIQKRRFTASARTHNASYFPRICLKVGTLENGLPLRIHHNVAGGDSYLRMFHIARGINSIPHHSLLYVTTVNRRGEDTVKTQSQHQRQNSAVQQRCRQR